MAAVWTVLGFLGAFLVVALGDLVSEEIRGWLDLVPRGILRLAAARLEPAQRETIYSEEWLPELCYALRGAESRPVTRLVLGIRYALRLLVAARRVSRYRSLEQPVDDTPELLDSAPPDFYYLPSFTNSSGAAVSVAGVNISNGNTWIGDLVDEELDSLKEMDFDITWVKVVQDPVASPPRPSS